MNKHPIELLMAVLRWPGPPVPASVAAGH